MLQERSFGGNLEQYLSVEDSISFRGEATAQMLRVATIGRGEVRKRYFEISYSLYSFIGEVRTSIWKLILRNFVQEEWPFRGRTSNQRMASLRRKE